MTALRSAVALAASFATLAALVAAGALTRVDQWGVDHLMPSSGFRHARVGLLEAAVPLLHQRWDSPLALATNVVTLPASALLSLAIVVAASRVVGFGLLAAWAAGSAVELVCKHVLVRPALHDGAFHVVAFDSSFPSGHALRAVLVAGALAAVWPRTRLPALVWVAASVVLLLLAGWHTPTDLAGGLLLGGVALMGATASSSATTRRPR